MYDISSAVRCQLIGVRWKPARRHAAQTSTNSGRLRITSATPSPSRSPLARIARTSWFAWPSSCANVRFPYGEMIAARSGTVVAQYATARPSAVERACRSGSVTPEL